MSTEQKDLEQNALASRLSRNWEKFKQGQLISYRMMAFLIIAVTAIGLTWYILRERAREASRVWYELEGVNTVSALEEFSKNHSNSKAGKVARLHWARTLLGPEGIEALAARDPKAHQTAVENIETKGPGPSLPVPDARTRMELSLSSFSSWNRHSLAVP